MQIGYVSPAAIRLPWELMDLLPEGTQVIATNLRVRGYTDAEFARAQAGIEEAMQLLTADGAQAVLLAGVPVAVREGYAREQERLSALRARFGVPVISGIAACVEAFRRLGVRAPLVVTAYLDEMNQQLARYLAEAGLPPAGVAGLRSSSPAESGRLGGEQLARLTRELRSEHPEADGVFLGARVELNAVAAELEGGLGIPVLHANHAGVWWLLRELGFERPLR
jgi:maleate cis-trans isomerase